MKFYISRKKWARGGINGQSFLVNTQGGMCCLGFYGEACGVPEEKMLRVSFPNSIDIEEQDKFVGLIDEAGGANGLCRKLMKANDDKDTTDEHKESEIKRLFKKIDVEVVFKP
jgi:hypothetical protein